MGLVLAPTFTRLELPISCVAAGVPVRWLDVDGVHMDFVLAVGDLRPTDTLLEQHTFRHHAAARPWLGRGNSSSRTGRIGSTAPAYRGPSCGFSLEPPKVYSAGHGGLLWVRDPVLRARICRERDALPLPSSAEARRVLRTSAAQRALATGGVPRGVRSIARRVAFRVPGRRCPRSPATSSPVSRIRPTRPSSDVRDCCASRDPRRGQKTHRAQRRHRLAEIYAKELGSLVPEAARDGSPVGARQCSSKMPRLSGASCANAGSISASHGSAHQSIRPAAAADTRP